MSRSRLLTAHAEFNKARNDLASSSFRYQQLTGEQASQLDFPAIEEYSVENLEQTTKLARQKNNRLLAGQKAKEISILRLQEQKANYWPELELVADYNKNKSQTVFRSATGANWSIALELNLSIFNGLLHAAQIKEAKFNQRVAAFNWQEAKTQVESEAYTLVNSIKSALENYRLRKEATINAEKTLQGYLTQYKSGTRTTEDVLDARQDIFTFKRNEILAQSEYLILYFQRKSLLGEL